MKKLYKLIVFGSLLLTPVVVYGANHSVSGGFADSEVTNIQAVSKGGGALITWRAERAGSVIGFSVYRFDGKGFVRVNGAMVPGPYVSAFVRALDNYSYYDPKGSLGQTYKIEVTEASGNRYFSSSTQSIYSAYFEEPVSADAFNVGTGNISIKNVPSLYLEGAELTDNDKQRWVAAQPGAKILVSTDGFTRVTRAALANAGFDVNAPESNWQLFMDGIEQAIKIGPNGSYIEFYGTAVDKLETGKNVYFLVVGPGNGKRINPLHIRRIGGAVLSRNFDSTIVRNDKVIYLSSLLNGAESNFFSEIITATPVNVPFDFKGLDPTNQKAELVLDFHGFTYNSHSIGVVFNGEQLSPAAGSGRERFLASYMVPASLLQENGNNIELKSLGTSDISLLVSISVKYPRKYELRDGKLLFPSKHYRQTRITGVTDNQVRVFELSDPGTPYEVSNAVVAPDPAGGFNVTLPAARGRKLLAVEPSAILSPSSVVPNNPSDLYSASNAANFVIITYPGWKNEAVLWANYRASQGMQTMVVDINDVFDEFSFGRVSAASMTSFLQRAFTSWATRPSHVLLMGDSTYDPRNFEGQGDFNFVPVMMVDTLYEETGSDDALTDFDGDGLAEIPIGRIPARAPVDVTNALQKVMNFESAVANAPARGALCASDFAQGFDFQGLCGRLHDQLPPSIPKTQVNRGDPAAKTTLVNEMNTGKYIVNYSGHGSTGVWAATSFFGSADAAALTNQSNLSLFTMLTCLNGYFIRPVPDGLSETLLRSTSGGAVAVWSSTGSTTPDVQEVMATRFYNRLGAGSMNRLGNLINDAKSNVTGGRDVRLSWVLLGDPATIVKSASPAKVKAGF